MKVSLEFRDSARPGTMKCEVSIEFTLDLKKAEGVLRSLQAHDLPAAIARAWSEADKATEEEGPWPRDEQDRSP